MENDTDAKVASKCAPDNFYQKSQSRKAHRPKFAVQITCVSNQCKPLRKKQGDEKELVNMVKIWGK